MLICFIYLYILFIVLSNANLPFMYSLYRLMNISKLHIDKNCRLKIYISVKIYMHTYICLCECSCEFVRIVENKR